MMIFTTDDAGKALAIFVFVFWQKSNLTTKQIREIYSKTKQKKKPLESWIFGVIWFFVFSCLFVSGYFFMYSEALVIPEGHLIGIFISYFVAVYLTKEWMVWFFDNQNPDAAFWILLGNMAATIAYLVLTGYNVMWVSFATGCPLLCALIFAWVVSCQLDIPHKPRIKKTQQQQIRV